ncbi:MAG: glycosyltransferase [Cytophagales bacterium]
MNRKLKVLTLGWEFPPIINGGLGVACYGLTKAFSKYVNISLILPKGEPSFLANSIETIGLNTIDVENLQLQTSTSSYKFLSDVDFIDANLLPYQTKDIEILSEKYATTDPKIIKERLQKDLSVFDTDDLYDGSLGERVQSFAKVATILAAQKDFDIIHAHDWMTFVAGMEIKAFTGKPLVLHVHSLEVDRNGPESKGWVYQIEKSAMEYADLIVPVSNYTAGAIKTFYGINPDKIVAIHNGIEQVQAYRSESSLPEKIVLFLGRVTGQKGPEYFFETAAKVIEFMPNVRFVMAGSGNMLKGIIENSAYKHLGNKFHFTGFLSQERVRYLLSIADVYVMPSVSEPFGLSALEAAQFGVPCVISKQSGAAEVLPSALKADFWDVDKMAGNIISILKYKGLRDQLVKDAYHDLSKISWDNTASELFSLFQERFSTTK